MEDNALTITSFVVRFIHSGPPDNAPLRGSILNVQTNEEHAFLHWEEAVEFIRRFVQLTNDERRTTNDERRTTNEERRSSFVVHRSSMTRIAQILSTGSYVPERVVTNDEIDRILGEPTGAWLEANVGIRERRWMSPEQTTSDLIVEAARKALDKAGIAPEQLNLIIVSTDTPDYLSPGTSVVVQHKLGAVNAGAYDVNSACAGWVTALDQGARYIATDDTMNYILVAGGYGMSRFLDLTDKKTANLFADGAGAAVLGVGDAPGFLAGNFLAKGEYYDALGIYGGGAALPSTPENVAAFGPPRVAFVKKFPRTFNTEYWPKLMQGALDKAGLTMNDIDHFLFTQLNLRTIEAMMELIGQPLSKAHWVMDKWGYTGSPCVIMALDDAIENGRGPQPGQNVLFCASGGGISMAASVWRWTHE